MERLLVRGDTAVEITRPAVRGTSRSAGDGAPFVCRGHMPVTDMQKFGSERRSTRLVDGVPVTDYFASDFTIAEIKTLRAVQPMPARPQEFNGAFERTTSSTPNARPAWRHRRHAARRRTSAPQKAPGKAPGKAPQKT